MSKSEVVGRFACIVKKRLYGVTMEYGVLMDVKKDFGDEVVGPNPTMQRVVVVVVVLVKLRKKAFFQPST